MQRRMTIPVDPSARDHVPQVTDFTALTRWTGLLCTGRVDLDVYSAIETVGTIRHVLRED